MESTPKGQEADAYVLLSREPGMFIDLFVGMAEFASTCNKNKGKRSSIVEYYIDELFTAQVSTNIVFPLLVEPTGSIMRPFKYFW